MTTPTRARECQLCLHWDEGAFVDRECKAAVFRVIQGEWFACYCGHRPRFYKPRSPVDRDWGWKRVCDDFEEREPREEEGK